jgi:hypothetical protein
MHEMTGVPESALGQMQPISNTSGVALAIMYQPMMQRYHMKRMTYTNGFEQINDPDPPDGVLLRPADPQVRPDHRGHTLRHQPGDPAAVLNPDDPLVYKTTIHWPPPLPVDILIKLNEIQAKMALGLESKRGALADLGNEFPDEKMGEIFDELVADAKDQGALDMLKAQIQAVILSVTGIAMGDGETEPPANQGDGDTGSDSGPAGPTGPPQVSAPQFQALPPDEMNKMLTEIVTRAYGTRVPQRRNPDN